MTTLITAAKETMVDPDQGKLEATQARMSSKVCCFIKINGELLFLLFYVATEV